MTIGPAFDDVLAAARTGSSWAIAVLYRELQPSLVRYLDARSSGEGEDLASEVWLSAAPKLADFEGDEAGFRSWMFTIAHRRAVDHARRPTGAAPTQWTASSSSSEPRRTTPPPKALAI